MARSDGLGVANRAFGRGLGWLGIALAVLSAASSAALGQASDPVREGGGERREKLNAMELKPLDPSVWDTLTDWTGGESLTATTAQGKVVLFFTWASWYPQSTRQLTLVEDLAKEFADKGLVVVGVHDARQWDAGKKLAAERSLSFRIAHDKDSQFRAALVVDQDPDFYLVDRAGQLRFADVVTGSVRDAVAMLVKESTESAAGLPASLAEAEARRLEDQRRTERIRQNIDLTEIPETLAIRRSSEIAFQAAKWPKRLRTWEQDVGLRWESDDTPPERRLTIPSELGWLNDRRPPRTDGRAVVVYLWSPAQYRSYNRIQDMLEALQNKHQRELIVVGVVTPLRTGEESSQFQFGQASAEAQERERLRFEQGWSALGRTLNMKHFIARDPERQLLQSLRGEGFQQGGDPIPLAALFSSDGVMRWIGNPESDLFTNALDVVLAADPWIAERRKVEKAWLEARPGAR